MGNWRCQSVGAPLTEAGLTGPDDGVGPVRDLELGEDVRDVVANRLRAEAKVAGHLDVGMASGEELEDFPLSLRQLGKGQDGGVPVREEPYLSHGTETPMESVPAAFEKERCKSKN